jgi:hypothetical protein
VETTFINADRLPIASLVRRRREWWRHLRRSDGLPQFQHPTAELRTVLGPVYLGEGLEFYFVDEGATCGAEFFLNLASPRDRREAWSEILAARPRLEAAFGGALDVSEFMMGAHLSGGSHARKTCWPAVQAQQIEVMSRLLRAVGQELTRFTDPAIDPAIDGTATAGWASGQDRWRTVAELDGVSCAYLEARLTAVDRELERRRHLN